MQDVPDLRLGVLASGNSNSGMLIDVHAHFYHAGAPRSDWYERNASRLAAGRKIGVTIHVASILGSWGRTSPIYFPSPRDVEAGNTALRSEEHTSELQSQSNLVCRLLLEKKKDEHNTTQIQAHAT